MLLLLAAEPARAEGELRILTYNLWHGHVHGRRVEPEPERVARHRRQIEAIRALDPDLVLLQEVSPAKELGRQFAAALEMDVTATVVNCGIQLPLPGRNRDGFRRRLGKPAGFAEGLAILARRGLGLERRGRQKLSGPPALVSAGCCLQFAEVEYALLATIELPGWGTVRVADAHLHAGGESERPRRQAEAARLIRALGAPGGGWIVGGDLNDVPDSPLLAGLRQAGLVDAVPRFAPDLATWGSVRLDYVLLSPELAAVVQRVERFDGELSDHAGLLVVLELARSPSR